MDISENTIATQKALDRVKFLIRKANPSISDLEALEGACFLVKVQAQVMQENASQGLRTMLGTD